MASSAWLDIEELISSSAIAVYKGGELDIEDSLLLMFNSESEKKAVGASIRWAYIIGDSGQLELMLQALPLPAQFVASKPSLRGDSAPVMSIWSSPVWYNAFNGEDAAGPVPVLCCASEHRLAISNDPLATHGELQKLAAIFFKPELLALKEAATMVKKPRSGAGEQSFRRKTPALAVRPAKRPRLQPSTSPGRFSLPKKPFQSRRGHQPAITLMGLVFSLQMHPPPPSVGPTPH